MSGPTEGPTNQDFENRLQRVARSQQSNRSGPAPPPPLPPRRKRSPVRILFWIGVVMIVVALVPAIFLRVAAPSVGSDAAIRTAINPIAFGPLATKTFDRPSFDIDLPEDWRPISEARFRMLTEMDAEDPTRRLVAGFESAAPQGAEGIGLLVAQERNRSIRIPDLVEGSRRAYGMFNFLSWFGAPSVEIIEGPTVLKLDGFDAMTLLTRHDAAAGTSLHYVTYIDTGYEILELLFLWPEGAVDPLDVERLVLSVDVK